MRYPPRMSPKGRTTHAEEVALAARIAQGDIAARDELVTRNLRLVHHVAADFSLRHRLDYDDLVQAGSLGLLEATTRYDPLRGTRFGTFATFYIKKAMTHTLLYRRTLLDTPYRHRHRCAPRSGEVVSLSTPIGNNGGLLCDRLADPATPAPALAALDVARLMAGAGLTARETHILHERFWEERTLTDIGREAGVGRERVRQLEALALSKLTKRARALLLSQ